MPGLSEYMTTKEAAHKLGFRMKQDLDDVRFGQVGLVSQKSIQDYLDKTQGMRKNDLRKNISG
jgi:hypothetical protein